MQSRVEALSKFGLEWWTLKLRSVIDKIVAAAVKGEADPDFWNAACKVVVPRRSGSVQRINGWVLSFLPYFKGKPNKAMPDLEEVLSMMAGFREDEDAWKAGKRELSKAEEEAIDEAKRTSTPVNMLQSGLSKTPFTWVEYGKGAREEKMEILSGFVGQHLTAEGYVSPEVGWAVGQLKRAA